MDDAEHRSSHSSTQDKETLDRSVWRIAVVAMLGSLLAQLDATIVNVSLSSLASDLHASLSTIQWVTSGYLLALAFALPLNGWLVERVGAKALYLWCFAIFTVTSALCGSAWSAGSLIGFRLLQGASGGLLAPMAQMILKRAAGRHFTRVVGYAALPVLLGPALGPMIAGAVLRYASWRWLFLINLPVGAVAFALAVLFLPDDQQEHSARKLDWQGLFLLSPGLALLLFGPDHIDRPAGVAATVAGASCLVAFLCVERRRGDQALIDLGLFRRRAFSAASATQFLWNGVLFAGQMLVPAYLMEACDRSATAMGWMLAPLGFGMMVATPSLGILTGRFGERPVAITGALTAFLSTLAFVAMAMRPLDEPVLAAALFVRGLGMGAVGLPAISLAYASIEKQELPMATTALNVVQRIGGPVATTFCALFLSVALARQAGGAGPNAWAATFSVLAMLHGLMVLTTATLPHPKQA